MALREMRCIDVPRLPVVRRSGALVGVLSLEDVLDAIASELQNVAGAIRNEQRLERTLRT
jgi:CBS domain-containing protein